MNPAVRDVVSHLILKDVPQVAAAVGTSDLNTPHAKCIVHVALYSSGNLCIECRPPTAGVKLGL